MSVDPGAVAPLPTNSGVQPAGPSSAPAPANPRRAAFDKPDGPSFSDLLDVLNPLQHIPVINSIYRNLTGDKEGAVADLVGGALWGGLIGLGAAMGDLVFEDATGKSVGDTVIALFKDDQPTTAVAENGRNEAGPQLSEASAAPTAGPAGRPVSLLPGSQPSTTPTPASALISAPATAAAETTDGPVMAGSYLIFGGRRDDRPLSLLPSTTPGPTPNTESTALPLPPPAPATAPTAAAIPPGPRQVGGFMVFGADQSAAATVPQVPVSTPVSAVVDQAAPPQPAAPPAAPPPEAAAAAPVRQAAATGATHLWRVPPRRGPASPPRTLAMPTTGPAAVPGNAARSAAVMNSAVAAPPFGGEAFAEAFNKAMDKYQKASALVPQPATP